MQAYSRSPTLSAYRNTAAHGSVAASDPHGLVLLLMNGALERIAAARGCIQNKAYAEKARLIHRAVAIIEELRTCLDMKNGGELATNLHDLYDYSCRQLLKATLENDVEVLDQVARLMNDIRDAWMKIPKDTRPVPAKR